MDVFAFLGLAAAAHAATDTAEPAKPKMPTFKRRRLVWNDRNFDARPVIWSLENRPEEWTSDTEGTGARQFTHGPSKHTFRIPYDDPVVLEAARDEGGSHCDCYSTGRIAQFGQRASLRRAFRRWEHQKYEAPVLERLRNSHDHFESHFIHD